MEYPGPQAVYAAGFAPIVGDHIRADLGDRCPVTTSVIRIVTAVCWSGCYLDLKGVALLRNFGPVKI